MSSSQSFFLYVQHLSGTGHFVRIFEIARILAKKNQVYLVDGGRCVPRLDSEFPFETIKLPRIYRQDGDLASVDSRLNIQVVMERRKNILLQCIETIKPDVLLIEHFPFSKAILAPEIIPIINLARSLNPQVKIVCSIRDICPLTKYESDPEKHRLNVLTNLEKYFDLILVHSAPNLVKLEDYIPWRSEIQIPIKYTGYVSQKLSINLSRKQRLIFKESPPIIVSVGGNGSFDIISKCIKTWQEYLPKKLKSERKLIIFLPLFMQDDEINLIYDRITDKSIEIKKFTANFLDWMEIAALSISQSGYNTCMNILETKTPAILIPDLKMSDQLPRAKKLSELGLVNMINPNELNYNILTEAIVTQINSCFPTHYINVDGADKTCEILNKICLRSESLFCE